MNAFEGRIWDLERRVIRLEWQLRQAEQGGLFVQQKLREVEVERVRRHLGTGPSGPPSPPSLANITMSFEFVNTSGVDTTATFTLPWVTANTWGDLSTVISELADFGCFNPTSFGTIGTIPVDRHSIRLSYAGGVMTAEWEASGGSGVGGTFGDAIWTLKTTWACPVSPDPPFHAEFDLAAGPSSATLTQQFNGQPPIPHDVDTTNMGHALLGGGGSTEFVPFPSMTPAYNVFSTSIDPA